MNFKFNTTLVAIICIASIVLNIYWLIHPHSNTALFIKFNIFFAVLLLLIVFLTIALKNES